MRIWNLVRYWDWLLFLLLIGLCVVVYEKTQHYQFLSPYPPTWLFLISTIGPLLGASYVVRQHTIYRDSCKNAFSVITGLALIGFLGLVTTIPRVLLLLQDSRVLPIQELDVVYVREQHYRKSSVITQIGIQYGDTLLRFESSRTNYLMLSGKRCIRAEVGQATPGFYFIRNLQLRLGEQEQARNRSRREWRDRVSRGVVGTGKYMIGIGAIILATWLLTRVPGVKNRLRIINR